MTILDLSLEEKKQLCEYARKIIISPSLYPYTFCAQSREFPHLSNHLKTILALPFNYLLFRDFPTDFLRKNQKTPEHIHEHLGETTTLARIQAILLSSLGGEILSYEAEGDGRIFQDIIPVKNMEKQQTSIGSNIELEIHTEQAFSKYRPDFLSLACLRSDPAAWTYILPVDVLLAHLSVEDIAFLQQPLWNIGVDLSFRLRGEAFLEGDIRGPIPILSFSESESEPESESRENYFLCFDQDLMTGITEEAQEMITKIVQIYYEYRTAICLQPGDILILDNRKVVHGRSAFSPKYDGTDRFLIRCFATRDYEKSESVRKGRMVLAKYS
jgi:L-asparagine oxygenase